MKKLNELPLIAYRISLHCPAPTKKRKDKEAKLTADAGAEKGAYRVQQEIIPDRWQKPISATQAKIRQHFEKNCFRVNDTYSIPIGQYESFEESYVYLIQQHEAYVNALCEAIDSGEMYAEAERRMGADFDPSALPTSCEEVKGKIRVCINVVADLTNNVITDALNELADDKAKEVTERIKRDQEALEAEGQSNVVSFVMDEIVAYLKDIQERVGAGADRTKYATLLTKFNRITEKLPAYNVTGNPVIANAIERIQQTFASLDKKQLKQDASYRNVTVEQATEILSDIKESLF